ncbi:hypothetical protein [Amycolatopsis sp. cg9]|uniref:hypothetical protein n=1 Tax=Amycolatopsis sp. cg9 TaxID=3238801 RepID=UPI003524EBFF
MSSTDPGVPVENTVRALRRLAPGAVLREPRSPDLRALARALRSRSPAELARTCPAAVARVVLAGQLTALEQAMTGLYGPDVQRPEAARLVRAARYSRTWGRVGSLLDRLRGEPGLRAAALGWAEVSGHRLLADELLGRPLVPRAEDGRRAAELAVAAVVPRLALGDLGPAGEGGSALGCGPGGPAAGCGDGRGGGFGPGESEPGAADGAGSGLASARNHRSAEPPPSRAGGALLEVRSLHLGGLGFRVDIDADPPVDLALDDDGLTLRALWWNGLGRVVDDLGYEYLLLAKDAARTGVVRHWCHPRPAPGARVLRLESAGYRGELLRLAPTAARACADVLVKLELTVRLGA